MPESAASLDLDENTALAGATLRGHVLLHDGSPACNAKVWNLTAQFVADQDGSFELNGASVDQPCHATLPGFQPAQGTAPGTDGIVLRLGPPTLQLRGRIRANDDRENQGWRIAILDATLLEPLGLTAATLESASSRASQRMQSSANGSFVVDGLSHRLYTLAAWRAARDRIELFAASPASPEQGPIEIQIPEADACRTVAVRCVDSSGMPLVQLRVGLPGAPNSAATSERGILVLTGNLPRSLRLVLSTAYGITLASEVDLLAPSDLVIDVH